MRVRLMLLASLGMGLIVSSLASAASVGPRNYNTLVSSSDLAGQLESSDGGLVTAGGWTNGGEGFVVAWNISPVTNGYQYSYSLTGLNGADLSPSISHFIIELSGNVTSNEVIQRSTTNVGSIEFDTYGSSNANPNLPQSFYGMKVNTSGDPDTVSFSFVANRLPVWGNFYAKAGGGSNPSTAYNSGITTTDGAVGYFVARPDSVPVIVPLPPAAFAGLAMLGVAGLNVLRNRRASI